MLLAPGGLNGASEGSPTLATRITNGISPCVQPVGRRQLFVSLNRPFPGVTPSVPRHHLVTGPAATPPGQNGAPVHISAVVAEHAVHFLGVQPRALRPEPRLYSVSQIPTMEYLPLRLFSNVTPWPGRLQPKNQAGKASHIMALAPFFDNRRGDDRVR